MVFVSPFYDVFVDVIPKWPQRTIRALKRQIMILKDNLKADIGPEYRGSVIAQLEAEKQQLAELYIPRRLKLPHTHRKFPYHTSNSAHIPKMKMNPPPTSIQLPPLRSIVDFSLPKDCSISTNENYPRIRMLSLMQSNGKKTNHCNQETL